MAKQAAPKQEEPIEKQMWKAADKLRKNIDAAEYKHIVLGLIFLKYISDAFDELSRATVIFHPWGQSYFPLHPFLGETQGGMKWRRFRGRAETACRTADEDARHRHPGPFAGSRFVPMGPRSRGREKTEQNQGPGGSAGNHLPSGDHRGNEVARFLHLGSSGVSLAAKRGEKILRADPARLKQVLAIIEK